MKREEWESGNVSPGDRCQYEICGNFCHNHSPLCPSQHIRWQQRRFSLLRQFSKLASHEIPVLWWSAQQQLDGLFGQNWRKPFHTSREDGCKDKGGDVVVRMVSINPPSDYNYNTALGAQRTCHMFCFFELQLPINKETRNLHESEISTSLTSGFNQIAHCKYSNIVI